MGRVSRGKSDKGDGRRRRCSRRLFPQRPPARMNLLRPLNLAPWPPTTGVVLNCVPQLCLTVRRRACVSEFRRSCDDSTPRSSRKCRAWPARRLTSDRRPPPRLMCVACTLLLVCFWLMHLPSTRFLRHFWIVLPLPNLPHGIFKLAGMVQIELSEPS